jgi:tetratricopeptide (TPR) repeat protein
MKKYLIFIILILIFCSKESPELEAKYKQAMTHFHKKELNESLKIFQEIKKENPDYKETRLFIGKIYYYAGKFQEASEQFSKATKHNSSNVNIALWHLKTLQVIQKEQSEKENLLKKAEDLVELDSSNIELLNLLARLYIENKQIDKALNTYRRILLFEDNISLAHFEMSKIYELNGLEKEKDFHLNKAILLGNQNKKLLETYTKGMKDESKTTKKK